MTTYHISLMTDDVPYYFEPGKAVLTVEAMSKYDALLRLHRDYSSPLIKADSVTITEDRTPKSIIPIGTVVLNQSLPLIRGLVVEAHPHHFHESAVDLNHQVTVAWQDGTIHIEEVIDLTDFETGKRYLADGTLQAPHITLPNISAVEAIYRGPGLGKQVTVNPAPKADEPDNHFRWNTKEG